MPAPTAAPVARARPTRVHLGPRLLVLLAAAPFAACGITDPVPVHTEGAELWLEVAHFDRGVIAPTATPQPVYRVEARLRPGTRDGRARRVSSDELRVGGLTLRPRHRERGELLYTAEAEAPAAFTTAGITVERFPTVDGLASPSLARRLAGLRRLDPDTITLRAGEDLRLHLALPHGDGAHVDEGWQLEVITPGALAPLRISVPAGRPPSEIVVPRELLPSIARPLAVQLDYHSFARSMPAPADSAYRVIALARTSLRWVVRASPEAP